MRCVWDNRANQSNPPHHCTIERDSFSREFVTEQHADTTFHNSLTLHPTTPGRSHLHSSNPSTSLHDSSIDLELNNVLFRDEQQRGAHSRTHRTTMPTPEPATTRNFSTAHQNPLNTTTSIASFSDSAHLLQSQRTELLTMKIVDDLRAELSDRKQYIASLKQQLQEKSKSIVSMSEKIEQLEEQVMSKNLSLTISWKQKYTDLMHEHRDKIKEKHDLIKKHQDAQEQMQLEITRIKNDHDLMQEDRDKYVKLYMDTSDRMKRLEKMIKLMKQASTKEVQEKEEALKQKYEAELRTLENNLREEHRREYASLMEQFSNLKQQRAKITTELQDKVHSTQHMKQEYEQQIEKLKFTQEELREELSTMVKQQIAVLDENQTYKNNYISREEYNRMHEQHVHALQTLQKEMRQMMQSFQQQPSALSSSRRTALTDISALQNVFVKELDRISSLVARTNQENASLRKSLTKKQRTQRRDQLLQIDASRHATISHTDVEVFRHRLSELEEENRKLYDRNQLLQERLSTTQHDLTVLQQRDASDDEEEEDTMGTLQRGHPLTSPKTDADTQKDMQLYQLQQQKRDFDALLLKKLVQRIIFLQRIAEKHLDERIHLDFMLSEAEPEDDDERLEMEIGNALRQLNRVSEHLQMACENKSSLIHTLQQDLKKKERKLGRMERGAVVSSPHQGQQQHATHAVGKRKVLQPPFSPSSIPSDETLRLSLSKLLPIGCEIVPAVEEMIASLDKLSIFMQHVQYLFSHPQDSTYAQRALNDSALGHVVLRTHDEDEEPHIFNLRKVLNTVVHLLKNSNKTQTLQTVIYNIEKELSQSSLSPAESTQAVLRVKMQIEKLNTKKSSILGRFIDGISLSAQDSSDQEGELYRDIVDHAKSLFNVAHTRDLTEEMNRVFLVHQTSKQLQAEYDHLCRTLKKTLGVNRTVDICESVRALYSDAHLLRSLCKELHVRNTSMLPGMFHKCTDLLSEMKDVLEAESDEEMLETLRRWRDTVVHVSKTVRDFTGEFNVFQSLQDDSDLDAAMDRYFDTVQE